MDELLDALRSDDSTKINEYACALLVTRDNKLNKIEANAFEHFAKCKVSEWLDSTIFKSRCYVGTITYRNKTYGFG
jgi:hypothetical protein